MKKGSALLIVLGMLSFMVVSAVAFSIFMRQNRLPSSFLRQRILARQLVKAGLSHAMSDLDAAIGDDPYPNEYRSFQSTGGGSGPAAGNSAGGSAVRKYLSEVSDMFRPEDHGYDGNRNYWRNRVFMGVYCEGYADGSGSASGAVGGLGGNTPGGNTGSDDNAHLKNTVSTFPLEGLAYIPPPLVNSVRYWSRRSPAATWKNLDYDSGRYAFCAVNVSDYLDINRLKANVMRDSSPDHRLSLAYLFEESATHASWGSVRPSQFDAAMDALLPNQAGGGAGGLGPNQPTGSDGRGRLVSLADYNMAISADLGGPLKGCGFLSQFCEFIKSPPSGAEFYTSEDQARTQKFITDSWYPGSADAAGKLVLYDSEQPPFRSTGKGIADIPAGLLQLMKESVSPVYNKIKGYLNLAERAALKDYVDEDNVPTSLALPTIERTPQLVGLMVKPLGFKPKITELDPVTESNYGGDQNKRATKRVWKLEGFQGPQMTIGSGAAVFPFKRKSGLSEKSSYDVQVLLKAYLVEDGRAFGATRVEAGDGCSYRPAATADWKADNGLGSDAVGCISLLGTGTANVKFGKTEQDALIDIPTIRFTAANAENFARPLFGWITIEQKDDDGNWAQIPGDAGSHYDNSRFAECGNGSFYYLNAQGRLTAAGEGSSLKWQYFVWVRILDGNNTVDMFPATMLDDVVYNGVNGDLGPLRPQIGDASRTPIVPIAGPAAFKLDKDTFLGTAGGHAPGDGDPGETLVAYCNDPRYNFAPEDWWFVPNGSGVNANEWYNQTKASRDGADYRQNDLFQFVSNQGYLQSMGEIQFLPLVRRDYNDLNVNNEISGTFFAQRGNQYNGEKRTGPGNAVNQNFLWKTRCAFGEFADHSQGEEHCAYAWGIIDRLGGVAVNPYSDPELLAAALANTPYDYIVAAEQENDDDKKLEDTIDLCFNARSSEAPLTWDQLQTISRTLQEKILAKGADWEEEWEESEEWDASDFFGVSLPDFHDVDRKFLFSYWKQCFGNNQQLFLVFVRAEPTVIGGSSAGHTPSQLGARAVALVWRDPVATAGTQGQAAGVPGQNTTSGGSAGVHKMRILFYHQFE